MNRSQTGSLLRWPCLMVCTLLCSIAAVQSYGEYIIEDPGGLLPGQEWWRIVFDKNGIYESGDGWGYGGGWYYYPQTDTYRQWFYRGPFDSSDNGCITLSAGIVSRDPNRMASATISFIWSTPEWSALGHNYPPLPNDALTAQTESEYVATNPFHTVEPSFFATVEPTRDCYVRGYNPEWVGVEITGRNIRAFRWIAPQCLTDDVILGACCNPVTGDCFLCKEGNCPAPYEWKGAGTTCAECGEPVASLDFGDAPDSYGTSLNSDGARHVVISGVYLGRLVDTESDGIPSFTATGDDNNGDDDEDGVSLPSSLLPGETATVQVTASAPGYLNAWIDFDRNGRFGSANEHIFSDVLLQAGTNSLSFHVPAGTSVGETFARFRYNRRGLLGPTGLASDGEVEDYKVSIAGSFEPQSSSSRGPTKWVQSPQAEDPTSPFAFNGWGESSSMHLRQILADDWQCQDGRPVTGFQWWGTFAGWVESRMPDQQPSAFHIAVWTDHPATGSLGSFSHPDTLVWETYCSNWTWSLAGQANDPRGINGREACFEFTCLLSQDQWFYQDATDGTTVYWLSIAAVYDTTVPTPNPWGWMTRSGLSGSSAVKIAAPVSSGSSTSTWPPSLASQWLAGDELTDLQASPRDLTFRLLTNEGGTECGLNLAPVYRFWSSSLMTHFYTINEAEKDKLIREYEDVWTYEGIAFYAYPPGSQPIDAKPVYRFRSLPEDHHFYTINEAEKNKLLREFPSKWILEGIVWYAYD
jgi:hypothetical protein